MKTTIRFFCMLPFLFVLGFSTPVRSQMIADISVPVETDFGIYRPYSAVFTPNVPSFTECEKFFKEYRKAVIFHFEKQMPKPEDRFKWTKKINLKLLKLEREVFISGYEKAFLLFMDSCNICPECPGVKEECKEPKLARPSPEAMCIDVYSTVRKHDYPIVVLSDYKKKMNRYAFLMIE